MTLAFDLLTLKVVSESRVTWATSVPILVFLGLSVLDLDPMHASDRRQTSDAYHRLMLLPRWRGHNNENSVPQVTVTVSDTFLLAMLSKLCIKLSVGTSSDLWLF